MRTYICAASAGGQGKTTLSQLLYLGLQKGGEDYRLAAADFLDDSGRSKIGRFFPGEVEELGSGASLTAFKDQNNPYAAMRYWDRVGGLLLNGGVVIDVGANVLNQLVQWAQHRHAAKIMKERPAPPIDLLLVCKAEMHSIQDVAALVRQFSNDEILPIDRLFVVLNEISGPFSTTNAVRNITAGAGGRTVNFVRLPRCASELWPYAEQHFLSIDKALATSDNELIKNLDIDVWTVAAGRSDLAAWYGETLDLFRQAHVF